MQIPVPEGVDIVAIGREVHAMYHAGATEKEAAERLKTRLLQGQYDKLPRLTRPFFSKMVKAALAGMWGPEHCVKGDDLPEGWTEICDEPR
jgi:hypothetical protein